MVISDLGNAELASPDQRFLDKRAPKDSTVPICTVTYRAPDILLGSELWSLDMDMWSVGCVAAELFLRKPLFQPLRVSSKQQDELMILDGQFAVLGTPAKDSCTFAWMKGLPFFDMFYGKDGHRLPANDSPEWPQSACEVARRNWLIFLHKPCSGGRVRG